MSMKTYRIELKMDFKNDALHEALTSVVRQYARDLLGAAMLLQDGYNPDIAIISDDAFEGRDTIELLDPNVTHDAA